MTSQTLFFAFVVAMAFAATTGDAVAATTVSSSKSPNADYRTTAEACKKDGGAIYTDATGAKVCVLPGLAATTINGSRSTSQFRIRGGEGECTARGGSVLTAEDGGKICVPAAADKSKMPTVVAYLPPDCSIPSWNNTHPTECRAYNCKKKCGSDASNNACYAKCVMIQHE